MISCLHLLKLVLASNLLFISFCDNGYVPETYQQQQKMSIDFHLIFVFFLSFSVLGLYSNIILNSFDIVYNLLRVSSLMDMVGFEHCLPGFNGYHWRICLHENRNESNHDNSRICEKLCMILAWYGIISRSLRWFWEPFSVNIVIIPAMEDSVSFHQYNIGGICTK